MQIFQKIQIMCISGCTPQGLGWFRGACQARMRLHASRFAEMLEMGMGTKHSNNARLINRLFLSERVLVPTQYWEFTNKGLISIS